MLGTPPISCANFGVSDPMINKSLAVFKNNRAHLRPRKLSRLLGRVRRIYHYKEMYSKNQSTARHNVLSFRVIVLCTAPHNFPIECVDFSFAVKPMLGVFSAPPILSAYDFVWSYFEINVSELILDPTVPIVILN